jgi:hypothetical protein
MRAGGIPAGLTPISRPDRAEDVYAHLVAVSVDAHGLPVRLFTTSPWTTGEALFAAGDVIRMLDGFELEDARPERPANRWLALVLRLFRPQIEQLLHERDAVIERLGIGPAIHDRRHDRGFEVLSEAAVDLDEQIEAVRAQLAGRPDD